jgi:hypothetical protein
MPRKCWASSVSECKGPMTGEHYITKALFPNNDVIVHGLPWCKEEIKIGINSLVSNFLCKKHNEELSPLDECASNFASILDRWHTYRKVREKGTYRGIKVFNANLELFDRWVLKVLCNLSILTKSCETPPERLKEMVFGRENIPQGSGVGFLGNVDDPVGQYRGVEFALIYKGTDIEGCSLNFCGLPLICSWRLSLPTLVGLEKHETGSIKSHLHHPKKLQWDKLNLKLLCKW